MKDKVTLKAPIRKNLPAGTIWLDSLEEYAWKLIEKTDAHDIYERLPKECYFGHSGILDMELGRKPKDEKVVKHTEKIMDNI